MEPRPPRFGGNSVYDWKLKPDKKSPEGDREPKEAEITPDTGFKEEK